jgi:hypothetical protein
MCSVNKTKQSKKTLRWIAALGPPRWQPQLMLLLLLLLSMILSMSWVMRKSSHSKCLIPYLTTLASYLVIISVVQEKTHYLEILNMSPCMNHFIPEFSFLTDLTSRALLSTAGTLVLSAWNLWSVHEPLRMCERLRTENPKRKLQNKD